MPLAVLPLFGALCVAGVVSVYSGRSAREDHGREKGLREKYRSSICQICADFGSNYVWNGRRSARWE
jgi:hypothetical protein